MGNGFINPPWQQRDRAMGGRKVKRERLQGREEGRGIRDGSGERGMEGWGLDRAVRNSDPFPRWPPWIISRPTAGIQDHSPPSLRSSGPAPRVHSVS